MRPASIAAALLLTAAIAGPASAGQQVPFRGTLAGSATVTPLNPPVVAVRLEATGTATYLGRFSLLAPHTVNQATMTAVGTYEMTAANGDHVFADFTGTARMIEPPNVAIDETATITGGTGRFTGATVTIHVERVFNHVTGVTTGTLDGWITMPNP